MCGERWSACRGVAPNAPPDPLPPGSTTSSRGGTATDEVMGSDVNHSGQTTGTSNRTGCDGAPQSQAKVRRQARLPERRERRDGETVSHEKQAEILCSF